MSAIIETGLLIPNQGYVQASGDTVNLDDYPEGTKIISIKPSPFHTLVGTEWVLDEALKNSTEEYKVRRERSRILTEVVDPLVTNPMRWGELTTSKQAEWTRYRKYLLDITDQSGFPHKVSWPSQPV